MCRDYNKQCDYILMWISLHLHILGIVTSHKGNTPATPADFFGVARGLTNAWWHVHKKIRKHNLERVLFWKLGCCTVWQLLVSLVAINGSLPHSSRFQHQHNIDTLPAVLITTRSCNILHFVQLKILIRMTSLNYALPRCQIFIALSPWHCRKVLLSFRTLINWPP